MMRNTTQRILTLAGMTLAAGGVLGMGATAATAATTQGAKPSVAQDGPRDHNGGHNGGWNNGHNNGGWDDRHRGGRDRTWTVGFFPNRKSCLWAGKVGEWRDRWDDSDCYKVNRRGTYVLIAHDYGRRGHRR